MNETFVLSQPAIKLLRRVQRIVKNNPKRVNMNLGLTLKSKLNDGPECGTVGCVAGWVAVLGKGIRLRSYKGIACEIGAQEGEQAKWYHVQNRAARLLGMEQNDNIMTELFFPDEDGGWGNVWSAKLRNTKLRNTSRGSDEYAKVVSEYISHFIKKYSPKNVDNTVQVS